MWDNLCGTPQNVRKLTTATTTTTTTTTTKANVAGVFFSIQRLKVWKCATKIGYSAKEPKQCVGGASAETKICLQSTATKFWHPDLKENSCARSVSPDLQRRAPTNSDARLLCLRSCSKALLQIHVFGPLGNSFVKDFVRHLITRAPNLYMNSLSKVFHKTISYFPTCQVRVVRFYVCCPSSSSSSSSSFSSSSSSSSSPSSSPDVARC